MATSHPEPQRTQRIAAAAALIAVALATVAAAAGPQVRAEPISLDAASSELDYQTSTIVFRDVVISQGTVRVAAREAEATGLDFENSRWTFRGDVRIETEGGRLTSGEAVVSFVGNAIARAEITGSPAEFEQPLRNRTAVARGRAGSIHYDVGAGTVRLTQDAWLSDGSSEIRGQTLVYDIRAQRVLAAATQGGNDRVRITIHPHSPAGSKAPQP
ncbi:MAG: lipopolysaccharide transport periplasmic protein LptA [Gammaproteobacteria bacterium]|nr:lipopolysaccharide transport periplasmic protein LptA [Gammaproteobacteria bacterium]